MQVGSAFYVDFNAVSKQKMSIMKSHAVLALLGFMLGISHAFPMGEDYLGASRREERKRENRLQQHLGKRYMETSLSHHLIESEGNVAPRRL